MCDENFIYYVEIHTENPRNFVYALRWKKKDYWVIFFYKIGNNNIPLYIPQTVLTPFYKNKYKGRFLPLLWRISL